MTVYPISSVSPTPGSIPLWLDSELQICFYGSNQVNSLNQKSYMIYAQVDNKKVSAFKKLINTVDSHAFVTITESKEILNGYFGK